MSRLRLGREVVLAVPLKPKGLQVPTLEFITSGVASDVTLSLPPFVFPKNDDAAPEHWSFQEGVLPSRLCAMLRHFWGLPQKKQILYDGNLWFNYMLKWAKQVMNCLPNESENDGFDTAPVNSIIQFRNESLQQSYSVCKVANNSFLLKLGSNASYFILTEDQVLELHPYTHRKDTEVSIFIASNFCSWCDAERSSTVSLKVCSRCRSYHYCSTKCQQQHWIHSHKSECILFSLSPSISTHSTTAATTSAAPTTSTATTSTLHDDEKMVMSLEEGVLRRLGDRHRKEQLEIQATRLPIPFGFYNLAVLQEFLPPNFSTDVSCIVSDYLCDQVLDLNGYTAQTILYNFITTLPKEMINIISGYLRSQYDEQSHTFGMDIVGAYMPMLAPHIRVNLETISLKIHPVQTQKVWVQTLNVVRMSHHTADSHPWAQVMDQHIHCKDRWRSHWIISARSKYLWGVTRSTLYFARFSAISGPKNTGDNYTLGVQSLPLPQDKEVYIEERCICVDSTNDERFSVLTVERISDTDGNYDKFQTLERFQYSPDTHTLTSLDKSNEVPVPSPATTVATASCATASENEREVMEYDYAGGMSRIVQTGPRSFWTADRHQFVFQTLPFSRKESRMPSDIEDLEIIDKYQKCSSMVTTAHNRVCLLFRDYEYTKETILLKIYDSKSRKLLATTPLQSRYAHLSKFNDDHSCEHDFQLLSFGPFLLILRNNIIVDAFMV
jgi:hypothetical protein